MKGPNHCPCRRSDPMTKAGRDRAVEHAILTSGAAAPRSIRVDPPGHLHDDSRRHSDTRASPERRLRRRFAETRSCASANGRDSQGLAIAELLPFSDSILLSSRASVGPAMVYDRRFALSRPLYAGTQVLFCSAMTLGS